MLPKRMFSLKDKLAQQALQEEIDRKLAEEEKALEPKEKKKKK